MTNGDPEALAEALYREARMGTDAAASTVLLVNRLIGDKALRRVPSHAMADEAALVRVGATWRIYVRDDLPPAERRFAALHEVAHWALGLQASEAACDRLAGALLVPRLPFLRALRSRGERVRSFAAYFGVSETCAWLRLGEVAAEPIAVVTPRAVRIRGAAFSWPTEPRLRELAERRRVPGLRKARPRGDGLRAVLRAI